MYRNDGTNRSPAVSFEADFALVEGIIDGDHTALTAVFHRYQAGVFGTSLRILHDRESAEDVLQEVFLQFWRRPEGYSGQRGPLGGWLNTLSRNRSIDLFRFRRRHLHQSAEEVGLPSRQNLAADMERFFLLERVRPLFAHLSEKQRRTLEMNFFEELTQVDIASLTATPLGTIKTRSRRGLAILKAAFEEQSRKEAAVRRIRAAAGSPTLKSADGNSTSQNLQCLCKRGLTEFSEGG